MPTVLFIDDSQRALTSTKIATGGIVKPFNPEQLQGAINRVLGCHNG